MWTNLCIILLDILPLRCYNGHTLEGGINLRDLTPQARHLYLALYFRMDESNEIVVGKYELSEITGYKRLGYIRHALQELEEKGYIDVTHRVENGYSIANRYRILKTQEELMAI